MNYAVIKTGGKQYKVSVGDIIEIDKISVKDDGKVIFEDVLLLATDSGVKIGQPTIAGEKVEGKLLEHLKGDKIRVSKFKSKVRYRRVTGFRASLTKVQIEKIGGSKVEKPKAAKAKKVSK